MSDPATLQHETVFCTAPSSNSTISCVLPWRACEVGCLEAWELLWGLFFLLLLLRYGCCDGCQRLWGARKRRLQIRADNERELDPEAIATREKGSDEHTKKSRRQRKQGVQVSASVYGRLQQAEREKDRSNPNLR